MYSQFLLIHRILCAYFAFVSAIPRYPLILFFVSALAHTPHAASFFGDHMNTTRSHWQKIFFFTLFCFFAPCIGLAQEPENKPSSAPDAAQKPDPTDDIVKHIEAMSNIVADNMQKPDELSELFKSYLDSNRKAMRSASNDFERKVKSLKVDEAELYRETLQRKMEPALERLMTLLLQFEDKHPEQARALDSMLKVDP